MILFSHRAAVARLVLPVALAASLAGAALAQETAPAQAPEAAVEAAAPDPAKVVATIDGKTISEADLALALSSVEQQYAQLPPEQRRAAAFMAVLEIKLLSERAVATGLDKSAEFERRMAFLRERALHSEVIDKEIGSAITEEDVRARYDKQVSETPPVNEYKARHILVKTEEEARAIIKQLDEGADFEALANEHTTDPSGKTTGGDLGYFTPGRMVPEFEKATLALEIGGYSKEPVKTDFGFHVIKLEDKRAQPLPAFEQIKNEMRGLVYRERYFALIEKLRAAASVEINDAELKKTVDAMDAAK